MPVQRSSFLLDVGDVRRRRFGAVRLYKTKTDLSEMQPVRVFAEPVVKLFLPGFPRNVADLSAECVVFARFQDLVTDRCGTRRRVPAPLRHCADRHRFGIGVGKRLQARNIAGECKFAVADRERRQRIDPSQDRIVTRDKSEAVYRFASFLAGDRSRRQCSGGSEAADKLATRYFRILHFGCVE